MSDDLSDQEKQNVDSLLKFMTEDLGYTMDYAKEQLIGNIKYPYKEDGFFKPVFKTAYGQQIKIKEIPDYIGYATYIKDTMYIKSNDAYTYYWDTTHYKHATHTMLHNICLKRTMYKAEPIQLDNFKKQLLSLSYADIAELYPPKRMINLKNGVLDVSNAKLSKHDPVNFFRYVLDHEYDPDADCPNFKKFLRFVFNDNNDLYDLTFEIFGYCLIGGDPVAHKAFVLHGDGRNGKSTWLYALRTLLGPANASAVSMRLLGKPFSMIQMDGKLANIVEESPAEIDPEDFKNIVGGGLVTAAHKGKPEFSLKIDSRLFFATNKLPRFNDTSIGIKDRLLIIPFDRYINAEERDHGINNKIHGEMSGIINMSLHGLRNFLNRGCKFKRIKAVDEMLNIYINESDSVHQWAEEYLEWTGNDIDFCSTDAVYKHYLREMDEFHQRPVGLNEFRRRVNKKYLQLYGQNGDEFKEYGLRRATIEGQRKCGARRVKGPSLLNTVW